jgi:hypothetical protein
MEKEIREILEGLLKDISQYSSYEKGYDECLNNYTKLIIANFSPIKNKQINYYRSNYMNPLKDKDL